MPVTPAAAPLLVQKAIVLGGGCPPRLTAPPTPNLDRGEGEVGEALGEHHFSPHPGKCLRCECADLRGERGGDPRRELVAEAASDPSVPPK